MSRGRAIWQSYTDVDMTRPCPGCGARPDTWCTNQITGRVRRAPCPTRPRATTTATFVADRQENQHTTATRDFSEPIHTPEGTP